MLRQALLDAQLGDTITFDPPTSTLTIFLESGLPNITTDKLTIDGSHAGVVLDGSQLFPGTVLAGLVIANTDGVIIRGLQIMNFPADGIGIYGATNTVIGGDRQIGIAPLGQGNLISRNRNGVSIHGGATGTQVLGNYIGTNIDGTIALGNGNIGIEVIGSSNLIGGESAGTRNVVSGNRSGGIVLSGSGTSGNMVSGNYIGTDATGNSALGNDGVGVFIGPGASNNTVGGETLGARNLISGNTGTGLELGGSTNNEVIGNYIGTDWTGKKALGNGTWGIGLDESAIDNMIGGASKEAQNLISGNRAGGITLQNAAENRIVGNYIGTDASGADALGNEGPGLLLALGASQNMIGGATEGERNIISGNRGDGITIRDESSIDNHVIDNYIGTDATGTVDLRNSGNGVEISGGAANSVISDNLISGNESANVLVTGRGIVNSSILNNVIGPDVERQATVPSYIGIEVGSSSTGNIIRENQFASNNSNNLIVRSPGNIIEDNGAEETKSILRSRVAVGNRFKNNNFTNRRIVELTGGTLTEDQTWEAQGDLDTYLIVEEDLIIAPGATLTVAPGLNVQFDFGLGVQISGTLIAEGTANQPIRFTSAQRFANPVPGDWQGLAFAPSSIGSLAFTAVEFAANGLTLNGGQMSVISSTITASQKDGLLVPAETASLALTLDNNVIAGNGQLAINNQSTMPISAPNSWWGSASGPNHASNPDGQGDAISANVNIESWQRDSGAKNAWSTALVTNLGRHHFMIDDRRSQHWFRIPVDRGATLTATLSHSRQDYDLFLFSNLEEPATLLDDLGDAEDARRGRKDVVREAKDILGYDTVEIGDGNGICSSRYIGQVANLGQANRGRLLQAGCAAPIGQEEVVSTDVWDQSGWYYLFVAGHNGANNNTISYTLDITLTEGTTGLDAGFELPRFDPPESSQPGKKSLILTNEARLRASHEQDEVDALMNKLDELATHPQVSGVVIDLDGYNQLDEVYQLWSDNITDTVSANYVAASVKALLTSLRGAYPDLENILIVGNDDIIPFRRIPDEVTIANERDYHVDSESALAGNLREGYFLSDDYYAGFDPIPYRGRGLFLPEYAQGRLVETPSEMMTAIDTFLESPVLTATTGLVTGYDFLIDQAEAIVQELEQGGLTPDTLMSHSWQADALKEVWLNKRHDLSSINAHFQHDIALPAERAGGDVSAVDVRASNHLTGSVVFSVGCHSGLPVAGSEGGQLDFAQVLVGQGAMYVANTGYGYGDANAIGYSEHLMRLFVRHLREGATVGQALRQAKGEYFNTMGIHAVTPYDEKVLGVATFYGFPMYQVRMPNASEPERTNARQAQSGELGPLTTCPEGLTCRQATFTPIYTTETVTDGTYFSVQGETQESLGQPILPRTSIEVFETRITNTFEITAARGVLFEGADYEIYPDFDPVITRITTDSTDYIAEEPPYFVEAWTPSERERISSLRTGDKITQRLVVIPAQYRSLIDTTNMTDTTDMTDPISIARRFSHMTHTIYYSSTRDTILPSIWQVTTTRQGQSPQVEVNVDVTDFSGIIRTVATYTTGYGKWRSVDLQQIGNSNIWQGYLPDHPTLDYLVQAVDGAGNVAIHDNKGRYFPPAPPKIYLPLIRR